MKRFILMIGLLFAASLCMAAQPKILHPSLSLMQLKGIKTSEKKGDELHFAVTVYPTKGRTKHYLVPRHPLHWPSKYLHKLKQLKLWDMVLHHGESVTLVLSLIEKDVPPWNTNDLIGTIHIHLKNNQGKLEAKWVLPNRPDEPIVVESKRGETRKFDLFGEGSRYSVVLHLNNITQSKNQ